MIVLAQFFIVLLILVLIAVPILMAVSSNNFTILLIFFLLFFLLWYKYPRFKCLREKEISKINGITIFLCYEKNRFYNAWFDPIKKKIGITKSLFDILSEDERKAVLYHEIGHSKNKLWYWIMVCMLVLWFSFASSVLTLVLLIVLLGYDIVSKIALSATFLTLLLMYAVSAMISSWINEHEADVYAVKMVGFKPKAQALMKLHIYSSLKECENVISGIEFSDSFELDKLSYFQVLKAIIWRVFKYMHPQTVLNQPLPETHPPLRLRLERIIRLKKSP